MIRIVAVRDGNMTKIMKISVDIGVDWQNAGLHEVTEHVHTPELGQRHPLATGVDDGTGMNSLIDAIAPSLQVLQVEVQLIHRPVNILDNGAGGAGGPSATRHQRIQLGEVTLRDRLAPIVEALHPTQSVAQTLAIVSVKREVRRNSRIITQGLRKFPSVVPSGDIPYVLARSPIQIDDVQVT